MVKEKYSLEIWLVNSKYYLRAYSVTTVGLRYTANNPIHVLEDLSSIGEEVMKTLKECQQGIPHPDYWIKDENEMLKVTGAKTEKRIMKEGKLVSCYLKEKNIKITPWYFDGRAMSANDGGEKISTLDPEDITKKVLEAFEHCHP
jgi:hypothetical protein